MRSILILLLAALAVPAQAAEPAAGSPPPAIAAPTARLTPDEARAAADRLISQARVEDLFENVSSGSTPAVRHKRSGFVCKFDGSEGALIAVVPGVPRGEDVQCRTRPLGSLNDVFITRFPGAVLATAMQETVATIRALYPDAAPVQGTFFNVGAGGQPSVPRANARLSYTAGGVRLFSRVSMAVVGDWVITQRMSLPWSDETRHRALDLLGDTLISQAVQDMAQSLPPPPSPPPGPAAMPS